MMLRHMANMNPAITIWNRNLILIFRSFKISLLWILGLLVYYYFWEFTTVRISPLAMFSLVLFWFSPWFLNLFPGSISTKELQFYVVCGIDFKHVILGKNLLLFSLTGLGALLSGFGELWKTPYFWPPVLEVFFFYFITIFPLLAVSNLSFASPWLLKHRICRYALFYLVLGFATFNYVICFFYYESLWGTICVIILEMIGYLILFFQVMPSIRKNILTIMDITNEMYRVYRYL